MLYISFDFTPAEDCGHSIEREACTWPGFRAESVAGSRAAGGPAQHRPVRADHRDRRPGTARAARGDNQGR